MGGSRLKYLQRWAHHWASTFMALMVVSGLSNGVLAQMQSESVTYFLDEAPHSDELMALSSKAPQLIVARVRVLSVNWRGGRHGGENLSTKLEAEVRVEDVLNGGIRKGSTAIVVFGPRGSPQKFTYPSTPEMLKRDYFVALYVAENGENTLMPFAVDIQEYERWEREFLDYVHSKSAPGVRR